MPLYFAFSADDRRCETTSPSQAPAKFQRVEPFSPSGAQLREYAGDYSSPELDVAYSVLPRDTGLVVRVPGRRGYVLESCGRDLFQTNGGEAFRFERDANGAVTKFIFISSGVWGLSFDRAKR